MTSSTQGRGRADRAVAAAGTTAGRTPRSTAAAKAPVSKPAPARAAAKKTAPAKAAATKAAPTAAVATKAAPTKAAATKAAPAKGAAAKGAAKKTVPAKVAPAKASAKKVAPAKAAVKKAAPAKAAVKEAAPAKAAVKKAAPAKAAVTKTAVTKTAATKAAATKAAVKKVADTSTAAKKATPARTVVASAAAAEAVDVKAATATAPAPAEREQAPSRAARPAAARSLKVREDESPWTAAELAEVQAALEADVARLGAEIATAETGLHELLRDSGDGAGDDQADAGAKTFEREQEISLANNSREMLDQSVHALAAIADGTYGVCESCGLPVGKMRLQAFPRATLCVSCKSRQERR